MLGGRLPCFASTSFADLHGIAFFEKRIRPALVTHCYECHSSQAKELKGGAQAGHPCGSASWRELGVGGRNALPQLCVLEVASLGDYFVHDLASDVRQSEIAAVPAVRETFVVAAHQVEDRGV